LAVEAAVVTTPYNFLGRFYALGLPIKALLPFEQLILARKIVLTSFIAFSQLGPVIMPPKSAASGPDLNETLERLHYISTVAEMESKKLLVQEVLPFADDAAAMKGLERRMGEWMVQQRVRNDPEVMNAMGQVLAKKRANAPHGAKGTK
jgi:hypothetical protein